MRKVFVVGSGATPVAEHWGRTAGSLAREALTHALGELPRERLGALYVANALGGAIGLQSNMGAFVADQVGLVGTEAITVDAGGASGGVALRQAYMAIASGMYDIVAVVGVEKTTDVLDGRIEAGLALGLDAEWEASQGVTLTSQWAMLMRRYMHTYGVNASDFAPFPVNAHANGAANKGAMYRFAINADKVRSAAPVAEPLTLLDCPTVADGAAVILLAAEGLASEFGTPLIRIAGSAVASDRVSLTRRSDPLWLEAAARATSSALRAARLSQADVQVLDVTDPHGIAAALALESSGFAERGTAAHLALEGAITPKGKLPIATGGGYKARGDVVGASGVYQIVELTRQLQGRAGNAQVAGARVALAQCIHAVGSTVATHVLVAE